MGRGIGALAPPSDPRFSRAHQRTEDADWWRAADLALDHPGRAGPDHGGEPGAEGASLLGLSGDLREPDRVQRVHLSAAGYYAAESDHQRVCEPAGGRGARMAGPG